MLAALVVLNVVHPGRTMRGRECDLPSRKERKSGAVRPRRSSNRAEMADAV